MARRRHPRPGDVYWIDPNPVAGREMKDRHRFVVITPTAINALGVAMTVLNLVLNVILIEGVGPIPSFGTAGAAMGTVIASGLVAVCSLSFSAGTPFGARYTVP